MNKTGDSKTYWNLSAIQFLFWFAAVTGTSYLVVFLQRLGYQPNQVGVIAAINATVTIIATPFWGMISDKIGSTRKVFLFCISCSTLLLAFIPVSSRTVIGPLTLMFLIIPIMIFFKMPTHSLVEAFLVQRTNIENIPYSNVRFWGSIGGALMCFILSFLLPRTGVEITFYLYGFVSIPIFILMFNMKGTDKKASAENRSFKSMGFKRLFKNYYFISFLVFALMMYIPANISITFLPFLVDSVGGDTAMLGLIVGYRALFEIPALFLIRPLVKKLPLSAAVIAGTLLYFIEAFFYTQVNSLFQIAAIQAFHGLGTGFITGAAPRLILAMAPEDLNSTAQTMHGSVRAIAGIIGSIVGGILIMAVGIRMFYIFIGTMLGFAILYYIVSLIIGAKFLKLKIPSQN